MEVDSSLRMEDEQLQQLVVALLDSSAQRPEELLDAEPHPSDQTLAVLADLVYTKKTSGESDADYVNRTLKGKLDGWKLLITTNNTIPLNEYFGAVFCHTGLQQVVVAHRGTDPKCIGAVYTDLIGICTNYTSCTNSAVDSILQVTGHSLTAQFAQITTFSVNYLAIKCTESLSGFEKNSKVIHAKTVGFDSPGARDMLHRIPDDYYNRYEMDRSRLDGREITVYLTAPNHINTCGVHLDRIYLIQLYVD